MAEGRPADSESPVRDEGLACTASPFSSRRMIWGVRS